LYSIDSLLALHTASLVFPTPISSMIRSEVEVDHSTQKSAQFAYHLTITIPFRTQHAPASTGNKASALDPAADISNVSTSRHRNTKLPPSPTPLNPVNSPKHPNPRHTSSHIPTSFEYIKLKSRTMDPDFIRGIYKLDS
jgi:hypothetical protein